MSFIVSNGQYTLRKDFVTGNYKTGFINSQIIQPVLYCIFIISEYFLDINYNIIQLLKILLVILNNVTGCIISVS